MNKNINVFEYKFKELYYYLFSFIFVSGNLALPYLAHQFRLGGPRFLPIYFFVLIAGYKFGYRVGITTALLSPLLNTFLTGMPPVLLLPGILVKGISMVIIAAYISKKTRKITFTNLAIIILGYQLIGTVFESVYFHSFLRAIADFTIGWPGLLIQLVFGYLIIKGFGTYGNKVDAENYQ